MPNDAAAESAAFSRVPYQQQVNASQIYFASVSSEETWILADDILRSQTAVTAPDYPGDSTTRQESFLCLLVG